MKLHDTSDDDPAFLHLAETMVNALIVEKTPDLVRTFHVDNWFNFKWLNFSGVVALQLGVRCTDKTIPPFVPNRIINDTAYFKKEEIYEIIDMPPLHVDQYSGDNLKNKYRFGYFYLVEQQNHPKSERQYYGILNMQF